MEGAGWLTFAGIVVPIAGTLNCIWGIAAIGGSSLFVEGERYVISVLNTMGRIILGFFINILIVYGLAAYGGRQARST